MSSRRNSRIFPVLSKPKLVMGVEDSLAIANIIVGIVTVFHFKQWQLFPVFIITHIAMHAASRKEPAIRKVYRKYATQADIYEPFPRSMGLNTKKERPNLWGKDVQC